MFVPDPNFRPNPARAIYVQSKIDQQLVDRLTPRIIALTAQNRSPITVYIDSRGGSVVSAEHLLRLLQSSNQDGASPCWLVTVVTGNALSAAADLLSSGNYVLAYPETTILYHGVRVAPNDPITQEVASALSESFQQANDRFAMTLARKSEWRFMWRFVTLRNDFAKRREQNPALTDLQCFLGIIREKLSDRASAILEQAEKRYLRYDALLNYVFARQIFKEGRTEAQTHALILKSIISFENNANKGNANWSLVNGGLGRINDDFFLLREYLASAFSDQFKNLCDRWGGFVLQDGEKAQLDPMCLPPYSV